MNSDLAIFASMKEGAFRKTPCVLSFFSGEVLVSVIDSAKQKSLKDRKKEQARNSGSGKIKASLSALSAIPEYVDSLMSMDREILLKENTRVIQRENIQKISFSAASERQSADSGSTVVDNGKLVIKLPEERISFTHREEDKTGRIKSFIRQYIS